MTDFRLHLHTVSLVDAATGNITWTGSVRQFLDDNEFDAEQVGKSYATRSIGDHECIYRFKILARTAKTVTVEVHGKTVKRGLSVYDGVEQFKPFGTYSMCAIISADERAESLAA